jgi:hypothetical protein
VTTLACAALAAAVVTSAPATPPEWTRTVSSVHWIVRDVDRVKQAWDRLGVRTLVDFGEVELPVSVRGTPTSARVRVALAMLDGVQVFWTQPLGGANAYGEFLKEHGEGVFALNHAAPSRAALDEELARLRALGVNVLHSTEIDTDAGPLRIVHLDTAAEGKYALGLMHGAVPGAAGSAPPLPFPARLAHFGFVARDLAPVSAYWARLGRGAFALSRPKLSGRTYRGKPGQFDQELGWQALGTVALEWLRPLAGPTVYEDFLSAHGEGVHHIALEVDDLDKAVATWKAAGFEVAQSGAWGETGKPGSGRFVYLDTESTGGVFVELLQSRR